MTGLQKAFDAPKPGYATIIWASPDGKRMFSVDLVAPDVTSANFKIALGLLAQHASAKPA